ncbi:MAG: ABC transporter permease [Reichenbachiella sp.]|uniref:ABC transporter permease n=1 Tax=Reichenbachiella sp. TaxID=2184521 RepID=UPI003264C025
MNKKHPKGPPALGTYLLKKIYGEEMHEEISGDFNEVFEQRKKRQGHLMASFRYVWDSVLSVRNLDLKSQNSIIKTSNTAMIKNYLKMALRVLQKHPTNSVINIFGLAIGMGVCLMIYQYIHFESSFDKFHPGVDNTYRVLLDYSQNGEPQGTGAHTSFGLGVVGKQEIPELKEFVRIHPQYGGAVLTNPENGQPYKEEDMLFVDPAFLQIFNFPLKAGNKDLVLNEKQSIVITERMAVKYFGTEDPMGQVLQLDGGWASGSFVVTGVLQPIPANSHLQFDFLMPIKLLTEDHRQYKESSGWGWNNFVTYVHLRESADLQQVADKYDQLILAYDQDLAKSTTSVSVIFQPVADIHLKSDYSGDPATNNGSLRDVQIFSIIAIIILVIAWVNYINLSTARAMYRAKEVGVRKSIGAFRGQLIYQFVVESALVNILAACLALGIAYMLLPVLNEIIGRQLEMTVVQELGFWISFLTITLSGSLLSGLYPAFILSAFKPSSMLGSTRKASKGGVNLRRGLIVFQFWISALLISGTYLVYAQISYMKNQELGINMEKIVVINGPEVNLNRETIKEKMNTFKNVTGSHHSISMVTGSGSVPGKGYNWRTGMWRFGISEDESKSGNVVFVDHDFTKTYDFEFLAGRSFSEMASEENGFIINEKALQVFGLGLPEEAIQQKLIVGGWDTVRVMGVIKDFHWNSLKDEHSPYIFAHQGSNSYISFKIDLQDIPGTLAHIEETYDAVFPNNPFNYFFLDDEFNNQYQADLQFGNLFTSFSILAIFISCLGLFGLVAFSTNSRIKEIGIRKALGAEVQSLMLLLSKEYMILLLIANVLAAPIIFVWGQSWLEDYAYKVNLGIGLYLIPGLILVVISLITVSYKTYAAAKSNPVIALKVE